MSYKDSIWYLREQSRKNSPWENSLWEPIILEPIIWDHEMPKYSDSPKIPRSKPIIICGAQGNNQPEQIHNEHIQDEQSFFDIVWDDLDVLNVMN